MAGAVIGRLVPDRLMMEFLLAMSGEPGKYDCGNPGKLFWQMHPRPPQADTTEHFAIRGRVGAAGFAPWIIRHAARLGLCGQILTHSETSLEVIMTGPPDLLDAMALACSLGPQEVWVDEIGRLSGNAVSCGESSSPVA